MQLLVPNLLTSDFENLQLNCRRLSWRKRCKKQKRCSRVVPNLKEICARRFEDKKSKRARQVQQDPVSKWNKIDVILEDHFNDLDFPENPIIDDTERLELKEIFSAKITSGPLNTTVVVGGNAILTCTVTGNPAPLTTISPVLDGSAGGSFTREMVQSNGIVSRVNVTNIIK